MIGRDRERAAMDGALDGVAGDQSATLLVAGEPGIGMSWLMGELTEMARTRGLPVAAGDADASELDPPLWPWWQALAGRSERDLLPVSVPDLPEHEGVRVR